jgi:ADP-ribosylglycohydrolase
MRLHKHDPEFHLAAVADPEKNERSTSQSNGSLMRAVPLALWAHRLPPETLAAAARLESSLTHPSAECCDAVAAYDIAIGHLVRQPGDGPGALLAATIWVEGNACSTVQVILARSCSFFCSNAS